MSLSGRSGVVRSLPGSVVGWWPAVAYPVAFLAASLAVAAQPLARRQTVLLWASTNLDNLGDHPVRALVLSAFLTDGDVLAWTVLAAVGVAGVVAAAGPWRAVLVAVVAHLVGTGVGEGSLGVRIAHGLAPDAQRGILDVGPSFVVVGLLVTTVVAGTRWWRLVALAGFALVAPALFDGLLQGDVTALGHVTAIVVGLAAGVLLLLGRRLVPVSGPQEERLTLAEPRG